MTDQEPIVTLAAAETLRAAETAERAGRDEEAIELYRRLSADSAPHPTVLKKIGDLYVGLGRLQEAGLEYARAADAWERKGALLKAIALWKQIHKHDLAGLEPRRRLQGPPRRSARTGGQDARHHPRERTPPRP